MKKTLKVDEKICILAYNNPFEYMEYKKLSKTYFFKVKFEKKMKFY